MKGLSLTVACLRLPGRLWLILESFTSFQKDFRVLEGFMTYLQILHNDVFAIVKICIL